MLPHDICDVFFRRQEFIFARNWYQESVRINRKIETLIRPATHYKCKYISNITYGLTITEPQNNDTDFTPSKIEKIFIKDDNIINSNNVNTSH